MTHNKTLPGYFAEDPPTRERVAVVEVQLQNVKEDVAEIKGTVKDIDNKLDEILLEMARVRKASTPPKKSTTILTGGAKQSIGATLGAGLLYILQLLTSSHPAQAPKPPNTVVSGP
jgi:hypothetical protein